MKPNVMYDRSVNIDVNPGDVFTARGYSLKLRIQRERAAYEVEGITSASLADALDREGGRSCFE